MRLGSVNYEIRGKTAILTLDEPKKLNALTTGVRTGVVEGLRRADQADEGRAIIIIGGGEQAVCAGPDFAAFDFDPEKARAFFIDAIDVLSAPERALKPVISAVNGIAYGG